MSERFVSEAKVEFIKDKYIEGYNDFYFADDAIKNVKGVKNLNISDYLPKYKHLNWSDER